MHLHLHGTRARLALVWVLLIPRSGGFSWGSNGKPSRYGGRTVPSVSGSTTETFEKPQRLPLPEVYAAAIQELQALESEPLCHRVAARLLVSNCQLLEGKDEASILTDSGRQIRDFVDAYAASLAICDLERGSFRIPPACSPFRESALVQLPSQNEAMLHASSEQINACLAGLSGSDSAWNTWISYRHKALRFCEAARADQDKAQNILLFQRLVRVLDSLVQGVEAELQKRMDELDLRTRLAGQAIDQLNPKLERLRDGLAYVEDALNGNLREAIRKSSDTVNAGLNDANSLQRLLSLMMKTILESNSQVAAAHEHSIELVTRKADDMNLIVTAMATAVTSSVALQQQLEFSRLQAAELAQRQDSVEQAVVRVLNMTEDITTRYHAGNALLDHSYNVTMDIRGALEDAAASASIVRQSFISRSGNWLPYFLWPAAAVIMGSYGLPPSALRNICLLALGETVGLLVSYWHRSSDILDYFGYHFPHALGNMSMPSL